MARPKKPQETKPMEATAKRPSSRKRTGIAVRLDLTPDEHARLKQCADAMSLTLASFARMATMRQVAAWERGEFK